jgi:hypothetical protein
MPISSDEQARIAEAKETLDSEFQTVKPGIVALGERQKP